VEYSGVFGFGLFGWRYISELWFCHLREEGVLKIIDAEVMIDCDGFTQRSGTVYICGDTKFV